MNEKIKPEFFRDFTYNKKLLPNDALRELEEGVSGIDEARTRTGLTLGWPGWGLLYSMILCHHKEGGPGTIIETGTNLGVTTTVLAQALIDAKVLNPNVITFELQKKTLNALNSYGLRREFQKS